MVKKIGISLRVENIKKYEEKRDSISHDWIDLFKKLNFIPILIPNKLHNVELFLKDMKLDGLILSGGITLVTIQNAILLKRKSLILLCSIKYPC